MGRGLGLADGRGRGRDVSWRGLGLGSVLVLHEDARGNGSSLGAGGDRHGDNLINPVGVHGALSKGTGRGQHGAGGREEQRRLHF